jgi:4-hydroxy-3-polyprenylbenzoate decarboxylase
MVERSCMIRRDVTSLRGTLDFIKELGELLVTDTEVDPNLEMAGIQKLLDGGPAILFNKVKGYPGKRLVTNVLASRERVARVFGEDDPKKLKRKIVDAVHRPLPPAEVKDAPCQEVVVDNDIDVWSVIPMISYTAQDVGRTLGAGNTLVTGKYFWGGTHVAFNRMHFRGKDYSSFQISPGSHMDMIATEWQGKEPIPMTINMGVPPAVTLVAGTGLLYSVLPRGCDELGVAGAIQGAPIEVVRARTVDAHSIANAELVIEGYLDTSQRVWESEESEKERKQGVFTFHPEWTGYMGRAYRTYKFQATAITHRKDTPIYYATIARCFDSHYIASFAREASFIDLAEGICPGLVQDVHIPLSLGSFGGVIFQVKKRHRRDEGFQRNILTAAISMSQGMRLAIAVDEDVDIYDSEDILWAISTRVEADKDILIVSPGGRGLTFQPGQRVAASGGQWVASRIRYAGGIALDATVPLEYKWAFDRPTHPIDRVDLAKWFSPEDVAKARASMPPYAKTLIEMGGV